MADQSIMNFSEIVKSLNKAKENKIALAAFNVPGADVMRAIASASADKNLPVIIQTSAGTVKSFGTKLLKNWFDAVRDTYNASLFLHLDHCSDLSLITDCIMAGWDMVMYDGSHLPFAENLKNTQEVVKIAHAKGVAVEAELGSIGGQEDGAIVGNSVSSIDEIAHFSVSSGADCIAIGFGNVHGPYATKSNLHWDILESAGNVCAIPLVLHGGTGLTESEFRKAINYGCSKANISTAIKDAYKALLSDHATTNGNVVSPLGLHEEIFNTSKEVCGMYMDLFAQADKV